jgi:hypothetical protein
MRPSIFAVCIAVAGCAHLSQPVTGVSVEAVPRSCIGPLVGSQASIAIVNNSNKRVSFSSYGQSGPPFELHPRSFSLLAAQSPTQAYSLWQVVLEEVMPPSHEVTLGPGDRAEFLVSPSHAWPSPDRKETFKFEVRDTYNRSYFSEALRVCQPRSAPNNSFKPKPLRGSA